MTPLARRIDRNPSMSNALTLACGLVHPDVANRSDICDEVGYQFSSLRPRTEPGF